ncbi:MAG: holo-ACP synthase [Gammaproteobacteria bacterium]|nr:holo-ACP synthase [Gammaproteobacteria bacterium]MDH3535520.1 holo-ACP synthase [Gammaproteobacteria bacterium]
MIVGIGVDIAEIERVRKLAGKFGQRFARRILTDAELIEFDLRKQSSSYLATRFAAKEAAAKALGTGIGKQFGFQSVQIDHDEQGRPLLRFLDNAAELIAALKIKNALISLSDEKHYVVAMVVLES